MKTDEKNQALEEAIVELRTDEKFLNQLHLICNEVIELLTTKHNLTHLQSLLVVQTLLDEHPATKQGYSIYLKAEDIEDIFQDSPKSK